MDTHYVFLKIKQNAEFRHRTYDTIIEIQKQSDAKWTLSYIEDHVTDIIVRNETDDDFNVEDFSLIFKVGWYTSATVANNVVNLPNPIKLTEARVNPGINMLLHDPKAGYLLVDMNETEEGRDKQRAETARIVREREIRRDQEREEERKRWEEQMRETRERRQRREQAARDAEAPPKYEGPPPYEEKGKPSGSH